MDIKKFDFHTRFKIKEFGIVSRLRRVTSSGRFIPEVDGLRFVALTSVVLFHISGQVAVKGNFPTSVNNEPLLQVLGTGHIGVQLFFVVSGFILALPFASQYLQDEKPVSLRAYYLRRLTRLEPPYLISLFLLFALLVIVLKGSLRELLPHLLASMFYVHNLVYRDGSPINYVAWSLEVEVQFYLLAPLLANVFRLPPIIRRTLMSGLILAFVAVQEFWLKDFKGSYISLLGQAQFFVTGFLLADVYLTQWRTTSRPRSALGWDVVAFVGWPLFFAYLINSRFASWLLPVAIFVLYAAVFRSNWCRQLLSWPPLTAIGGMCYSIYLLHFAIIAAIWRVTGKLQLGRDFTFNFLVQCALLLPAILGLSTLFYLLVEKPCMRRDWPAALAVKLRKGILLAKAN